jgi:hypothetical protein
MMREGAAVCWRKISQYTYTNYIGGCIEVAILATVVESEVAANAMEEERRSISVFFDNGRGGG